MAKLPTLEKRRRVIEEVKDKFAGKELKLGEADCVKLVRFHLTRLGHKLPSTGHYKTEKEAVRQLMKQKAKNLAELWDQHLERIAPAAMIIGDIGMPPSDPDMPGAALGTVVIKISGQKFLGWHPDVKLLAVMDISQIDIAWRA